MGYGGIDKSEDNLASFQNSVNTLGAQEQNQAAQEQASAYQAQAGYAIQYASEQEGMQEYETNIAAGQQTEGYASGGVSPGEGTPLAMVNTTRALGQLQVNALQEQGQLEAQLDQTNANVAQQSGLEDILSAEGENVTNTQQVKINQAIQNTQLLDSLLTGGIAGIGAAFSG